MTAGVALSRHEVYTCAIVRNALHLFLEWRCLHASTASQVSISHPVISAFMQIAHVLKSEQCLYLEIACRPVLSCILVNNRYVNLRQATRLLFF